MTDLPQPLLTAANLMDFDLTEVRRFWHHAKVNAPGESDERLTELTLAMMRAVNRDRSLAAARKSIGRY